MIVKLQFPLFPSQGQHSPAFLHTCGSAFAKIPPIMFVLQVLLKWWDIKEEEQRNGGRGVLLTKKSANVSILLSIPALPSASTACWELGLFFSPRSLISLLPVFSPLCKDLRSCWLPLDSIRENVLASRLVSDCFSFC